MAISLELSNLVKTFPADRSSDSVVVIKGIHCRIEKGQFVSIVGPSGCGKTTILRIIAGLESATTGQVLLDGKTVTERDERVGLVFQEFALYPWRTTIQNIEMGLEIYQ